MSFVSRIMSILNVFSNEYTLKKNKVVIGKDLHIRGRIYIRNIGGRIIIGHNVIINSAMEYNPIGGDEHTRIVADPCSSIIIGNNVAMSNACIFSKGEIRIDDGVMIGGSCKIYDSDFHSLIYEERIQYPDTNIRIQPVYIKKNAFIGAHTIILKGTTIGERSVIGAGSVVSGNIPDGEIWAGNPAKFLRRI